MQDGQLHVQCQTCAVPNMKAYVQQCRLIGRPRDKEIMSQAECSECLDPPDSLSNNGNIKSNKTPIGPWSLYYFSPLFRRFSKQTAPAA